MKRKILSVRFMFVLLITCLFTFSCSLEDKANNKGALSIKLTEELSRTLLPELSMEPTSYEITGNGPNVASFTETISEDSLTVNKLDFGLWTVSVNAYNADGTLIGSGNGEVTVHSNETSDLTVVIRPLVGDGSLDLTLNWSETDIETPQVTASLLPSSGEARDLTFIVNSGVAKYNAADFSTGYHTLSLQLFDNGALTMGTVEVLRIVKDQATTGVFTFDKMNKPGGTISVNIEQEMANPLEVLISGASDEKPQNSDMLLTASIPDYTENVTYVWYVNGNSVATGETFSFDTSYEQGYYNISVTAFSADGLRAGSETSFVTVVPAPRYAVGDIGPAGGWVFYDDEADGVDDIPGFRYLEAAPKDISGTKNWSDNGDPNSLTPIGIERTAIGTGQLNTTDIITKTAPNDSKAADFCDKHIVTYNLIEFDDWYLPSKDEMTEMYNQLEKNNIGDFVGYYYWSSSENRSIYGWYIHFGNGTWAATHKNSKWLVRPIRSFN